MAERRVVVDDPRPKVRRITLDHPEKRNALSAVLRGQIFEELHRADGDPGVSVVVIRGNGPHFCAGYDLTPPPDVEQPYFTSGGEGWWPRHVTDGWMTLWDLSIPVIAQIHGACLAGGTELTACCDLAYAAHDARIGYPAIRTMATPDMVWHPWYVGLRKAAEQMLTGDSMSGDEAVTAGFLNAAFPADDLDDSVLAVAERVALMPRDLLQLNKRALHRSMEAMGIRTAIRQATELTSLALHSETSKDFLDRLRASRDVVGLVAERDEPYGRGT